MNFTSRGPRLFSRLLFLLPAFALVVGCHNPKYAGYEPTSRSFYEDPDMSQSYIGVDFSFTLDNPDPHWRDVSKFSTTGQ